MSASLDKAEDEEEWQQFWDELECQKFWDELDEALGAAAERDGGEFLAGEEASGQMLSPSEAAVSQPGMAVQGLRTLPQVATSQSSMAVKTSRTSVVRSRFFSVEA